MSITLALLIAAGWGGNSVATRVVVDSVPPIYAAACRFAVASNASCRQAAVPSRSRFAFFISAVLAERIFGDPGGFSFFLCGQSCAFLLLWRW